MEGIASSPQNFFSDYTQGGSGIDKTCISAAQPANTLPEIFKQIQQSLTVARLIPNGTT